MINLIVNINDIDFRITNIEIEHDSMNIGMYNMNKFVNTKRTIAIKTETSNDNYKKIANWQDDTLNYGTCKKDLIYNTVQIRGIFPVDYSFCYNHINVTLSADSIDGNIELFISQKLRKKKLEKINAI